MPRLAKSLEQLRDQVDAIAPNRNTSNDGWIGDEAHAARVSDHNPDTAGVVHALDITKDTAHGVDVQKIADDIIASDDKRVTYLIHAGRIANPDIQNWKWRARNKGPDDHAEHLHVSVKSDPALADDVSPWPVQASAPSGQIITQPKLKSGDRGDWVRELQRLLGIEQDGEFGEMTEAAVRAFQENHGLAVDGIAGRYTWRALLPASPQQSEPARIFSNIKATVFNDAQLAYGPRPADTVGVSLPARFEKPPKLWLRNRANGLTTIGDVIDVGPWNTNDPYWERNGRPQAESGSDKQGRRTNRAGIDLYPETARRLGIAFGISDGKVSYGDAQVDWGFADEMPAPPAEDADANIKQALAEIETVLRRRFTAATGRET
jgi:Putative peptidoglycan binding domain